ncbi:MAG: methionyl-tRNA formyltransferase [Oscillospiraceae bacterium]|nr:methionyl-tRNA formyltransferase [Oscillospiraceae bacterium]
MFMGTPEFAKISLEHLVKNDFNVTCAVTQPDKSAGRKMILTPPPVKTFCICENIPVYQPQNLAGNDFFEILRETSPDIIVVAAYGKILPKNVLEYPEFGCVNVHASLLPKYRGASPIFSAIAAGEKTTGITTIYMDEGIDTGDMILKEATEIGENETHGELHGRLAKMGGEVLANTLIQIKNGSAKREKQPETKTGCTKKTDEKICEIDWKLKTKQIHDKIRALSPSPAAFTKIDGKKLKIYKSEILPSGKCESSLDVECEDGTLRILELQPEGGKKMSAREFLNGRKIEKGAFGWMKKN